MVCVYVMSVWYRAQRLRRIAANDTRSQLLRALVALLPEEEMVSMVERILDDDDILADLNLPYLRRIRNEGRREGESERLLRLLRARFGAVPPEVAARVAAADEATLVRWSERILSAPTLDAVLAE